MTTIRAWHFLRADRRLRFGTQEIVEPGKTIRVDCQPVLCRMGLHASKRALDALSHAPGPIVCCVDVGGTVVHAEDKLAATERTVLWMYDATDVLRHFGRLCALDVIHLWDTPDVVVRFLRTGDQSLRAASRDAVRDAVRATPRRDRAAAWDAAWATMAVWSTAQGTAQAAAWSAQEAAEDTAGATAWSAARDAARDAQERRLTRMLREGRPSD